MSGRVKEHVMSIDVLGGRYTQEEIKVKVGQYIDREVDVDEWLPGKAIFYRGRLNKDLVVEETLPEEERAPEPFRFSKADFDRRRKTGTWRIDLYA